MLYDKKIKDSKIGRKKCLIDTLGKELVEENKKYYEKNQNKKIYDEIDVSHFTTYNNSKNISR